MHQNDWTCHRRYVCVREKVSERIFFSFFSPCVMMKAGFNFSASASLCTCECEVTVTGKMIRRCNTETAAGRERMNACERKTCGGERRWWSNRLCVCKKRRRMLPQFLVENSFFFWIQQNLTDTSVEEISSSFFPFSPYTQLHNLSAKNVMPDLPAIGRPFCLMCSCCRVCVSAAVCHDAWSCSQSVLQL